MSTVKGPPTVAGLVLKGHGGTSEDIMYVYTYRLRVCSYTSICTCVNVSAGMYIMATVGYQRLPGPSNAAYFGVWYDILAMIMILIRIPN